MTEADGSPLAGLRARLEEKQQKTTIDIPLPGALEDHLAIRYRALPWDVDEKINARDRPPERAKVERFMDVLIWACQCVLYRKDNRWEELVHEGKRVRIDTVLAASLDLPGGPVGGQPADTHVILRGLFALAAGGQDPADAERWNAALDRADHFIGTSHTIYRLWLEGGGDLGAVEADELVGE